jgi:hypothetical protein
MAVGSGELSGLADKMGSIMMFFKTKASASAAKADALTVRAKPAPLGLNVRCAR